MGMEESGCSLFFAFLLALLFYVSILYSLSVLPHPLSGSWL